MGPLPLLLWALALPADTASMHAVPPQRVSICAAVDTRTRASCGLRAGRVEDGASVVLDGRLDEAAWATAEIASGFRQQDPTPGAAASQRSEARVLLGRDALYVALRMFDTAPDSIRNQFVRRDDVEAVSDWASVVLDTYYDRRTAFEFRTNPAGTRVDVLRLEDTQTDPTWDAVWEVKTSVDAEGWIAEFRIPLSQLRFSAGGDVVWGVNFSRTIARRSETSHWASIPPTAGREVSLYGHLEGLGSISPAGGVEFLPYSVARVTRAPGDPANPFFRENETGQSIGLDVKYGVTSNLVLTATVNPDFGQVEADPSQVNLTAFEVFLPEQRPFFTEGTEIFNFRLLPEGRAFYSRRIGRAPQLSASAPSGGWAETPDAARILAAAKLSGKTRSGWSVGVLSALAGRVAVDVTGPDGFESQPLEPRTYYSVGRVRKDFREGRSGIGIMGTATNRRLDTEEFDQLRGSSYTGAFDWWHRFGNDSNYEFNGWLLGTHTSGSEEAMARTQRSSGHFFTRPDADHLTYDPTLTSMNGWAGEWGVSRIGGGAWTWDVGMGARSPGVELNDLGFLSYADTWYGSVGVGYDDFTAGGVLRSWSARAEYVNAFTFGMERLRDSGTLNLSAQFLNFWSVSLNTDRWFEHRWPWALFGGPALTRPGYTNVRAIVRSDSRRSWGVQLRGTARVEDEGMGRTYTLDPLLDLRPTSRATVSLGPVFQSVQNTDQWVGRSGSGDQATYVLGNMDRTETSVQLRLSYGFSPTLNLDLYAQPFLSAGAYSEFRTVNDPHASDVTTRIPRIPDGTLTYDAEGRRYVAGDLAFRDPDFNLREFRMNAVLRWEYLPGSTVFLVWNQARRDGSGVGAFDLGRDFDRLWASPATNVFLIKVNYWLGL